MSQLVKISFRDSQNWTNVNSEIINWDNLSEFYKDEETAPHYLSPQIFADVWNGLEHDVQHLRWDVFRLEFIGQSSEIIEISIMQSCDTILIQDINSNMLIQAVDVQKSEWLSFAEPERVADTSSWRLVLIYRTNKTVINKFEGLTNQVVVVGGSATYNSKYEKIPLDLPLEQIKVPWGEDGEKLLQETQKSGSHVLFYMNKSDKDALLKDWGQNDFTIDGVDVISAEKIPLEITNLGEDNYKIVLSGVTTRDTVNSTNSMPTISTLTIDVTGTVFNSAFVNIEFKSEIVSLFAPLGTGGQGERLLRESYTTKKKALFYFTESELLDFETKWNTFNTDRWAFDGVTAVQVKRPLEIEEMSSGLYKVVVIGDIDLGINHTEALFGGVINPLVITDTGGPYTFYTDYPTFPDVPDAEKEPISNDDGLPVDPKIISRQVTNIKLYLNTADKNSLKLHYEKGTAATINAVPILYRGIVETDELDIDIWEVNIVGLTTMPLVTNPL